MGEILVGKAQEGDLQGLKDRQPIIGGATGGPYPSHLAPLTLAPYSSL